jgi:hypothetical protein
LRENKVESLDYWGLCDQLNVVEAALLVVGEDPSCAEYTEGHNVERRPNGYEAAKRAIFSCLENFIYYEKEYARLEAETAQLQIEHGNSPDMALEHSDYLSTLKSRAIKGTLIPKSEDDQNGNHMGFIEGTIDPYKSVVNVESLTQWLRLKGFTTGFFFPEPIATMDFLDPLNTRYAPKLAAAVNAWQAVTDAGKKSPKQALEKWLREHAAEFSLTNDEGKPVETAIEECSKVANWNAKGGATKTPG